MGGEVTYGLGGDDVLSLSLVELRNSLDDHVVALGSTTRENDILASSSNEIGDMLPGLIYRALCFPTVGMRPTVGVSVLFRKVRQHLVQYPGVHGCRRLHIEVDWSAF